MRNNFNHQSKNVAEFIQMAYRDSDLMSNVFRPQSLGQFSKVNFGTKANFMIPNSAPDFKRIQYQEKGRELRLKPTLPP